MITDQNVIDHLVIDCISRMDNLSISFLSSTPNPVFSFQLKNNIGF